jgi:hypothetical protein
MMTGYTLAACIFVTERMQVTPHCHHNFGNYCRKYLIPGVVISVQNGPRYAVESKVVYSR